MTPERKFYVYRPNDGHTPQGEERRYVNVGGEIQANHEQHAIERAIDDWPSGIRSWLDEGVDVLVLEIEPYHFPGNLPTITRWRARYVQPKPPSLLMEPLPADYAATTGVA